MDRSRITHALPTTGFAREAAAAVGADVVIVDLARHGDLVAAARELAPTARIVGFGPHVDGDASAQARADGADVVVARSRFFRDPAGVVREAGD